MKAALAVKDEHNHHSTSIIPGFGDEFHRLAEHAVVQQHRQVPKLQRESPVNTQKESSAPTDTTPNTNRSLTLEAMTAPKKRMSESYDADTSTESTKSSSKKSSNGKAKTLKRVKV